MGRRATKVISLASAHALGDAWGMASRERDLQNHIWYWVTQWGGFIFTHDSVGIYRPGAGFMTSTNPSRLKGVADLLGIWKARPLAIEVKTARGRLSAPQITFREQWLDHGGIYIEARCLSDVRIGLGLGPAA